LPATRGHTLPRHDKPRHSNPRRACHALRCLDSRDLLNATRRNWPSLPASRLAAPYLPNHAMLGRA